MQKILLTTEKDGSTKLDMINTVSMIKHVLEQELSHAETKSDLIRQEIAEAKELFESYSAGVKQDEYEESIASMSAPSTPSASQNSYGSFMDFEPYQGPVYSPNASPLPPPLRYADRVDVRKLALKKLPPKDLPFPGGRVTKKNIKKKQNKTIHKRKEQTQKKRKTYKRK